MSFALTTPQVRRRKKTVTRRVGWLHLKVGDQIQPVKKAMGFKKGERVEPIGGPIRIAGVRRERLDAITQADVVAEGFPDLTPAEFVTFFCHVNACGPSTVITRIEFAYVPEGSHV